MRKLKKLQTTSFSFSAKMDPQGKVWLRMKVFTDCILSCNVTCPAYMVPDHANEKMWVVDNDGHSHLAIANLCPENAKTMDIGEFLNIYLKIKRMADEEKENDISVVPNN